MTDEQEVCPKCGKPHPGCPGHSKSGKPCGSNMAPGAVVCHWHGGKAPQVRAAANVRVIEAKAEKALATRWRGVDRPPVDSPLEELQKLAREVLDFKDELGARVADLQGVWTYWTDREWREGDGGEPIRVEAQENLRASIIGYERALDRCGKILTDLAKLGIEERLTKIKEVQALMVVNAVRSALNAELDSGTIQPNTAVGIEAKIAANLRGLPQ